jgi:uncharacterized protein YcaQ
VQLDPIDRIAPNAELVAGARVPGLSRGQFHPAVEGVSFEHFAKERCVIAGRFFPHYRGRAIENAWWRNEALNERVDDALLADVLAEITERGPLTTDKLQDRGRVPPIDWNGWKGTSSRSALACEALWTRCALTVAARDPRGRHVYDLPERALGPDAVREVKDDWGERMVVERVRSCGLLGRSVGPMWSMLRGARTDGTVERLLEEGALVEVAVEGGARPYLAPPAILEFAADAPSITRRILGPLDPLLWDRELVKLLFGFEYVWEIYKPAAQRRWGYYVCPVLEGESLIGRVEARRVEEEIVVERWWGGAVRSVPHPFSDARGRRVPLPIPPGARAQPPS